MVYTQVTSYRKGKEVRKQIYAEKSHVKSLEMYKATHPEEADCILVAEEYKGLSVKEEEAEIEEIADYGVVEYDFVSALKEVIDECVRTGAYSKVQHTDERGDVTLWLEAEWVDIEDAFEVVQVYFCFIDTGRVAYGSFINETKRKKK